MTDFFENRKPLIQQKILDIMIDNRLTPEEVRILFQNGMSKTDNERVLAAAEEIFSLFLEENLSISEGVTVMTAVKPLALALKPDSE